MKSRRKLFLVETEFGKLYLTPTSRSELYVQTFWPCRPLKVEGRQVYVRLLFGCVRDKWTVERGFARGLEEIPQQKLLPPALEARVTTEIVRAVSEWAKQNPAEMERAQRRQVSETIRHLRDDTNFLHRLLKSLGDAMAEISACSEFADEETSHHLVGDILHMKLLAENLPAVAGRLRSIDKRRLAA